jgi:hypothetical protein
MGMTWAHAFACFKIVFGLKKYEPLNIKEIGSKDQSLNNPYFYFKNSHNYNKHPKKYFLKIEYLIRWLYIKQPRIVCRFNSFEKKVEPIVTNLAYFMP